MLETESCLGVDSTGGEFVLPLGAGASFSCVCGPDAAGVESGSSVLTTVGDDTISEVGATVAGVPVAAAAAVAAAVAGPATAAAYRIGGKAALGADGTGAGASAEGVAGLIDLIMGSAFVLSIVDFLEGCFFAKIGLEGSSLDGGPPGVEVLMADVGLSFFSSLAGVLATAGAGAGVEGGEFSVISMTLEESRFESSSCWAKSCRYSSSSCRLRSS